MEISVLFFFWRGRLRILALGRCDGDGNGVAEFHDVVHQYFNEVRAGDFEFNVAKIHNIGGVRHGLAQFKFHLSLAEDGHLDVGNEADGFVETPDAGGPAVKDAKPGGDDGQLRHAQEVDYSNDDKISIVLLF